MSAFTSLRALELGAEQQDVKVKKVRSYHSHCNQFFMSNPSLKQLLSPVPRNDIPIYCVGLNYRSHSEEASVSSQSRLHLRRQLY